MVRLISPQSFSGTRCFRSCSTFSGVFAFDQPSKQCFWMMNTLIPLSAAFVADDGTIINIVDMPPKSLDSHCSEKPVRYVLEMNQGWFRKKGLAAGSRLSGPPFR